MSKLQLNVPRGFHTIEIAMEKGVLKTYKIPSELTVGEVERLLELQTRIEEVHNEPTHDGGAAQLRIYWGLIYAQLEIIFKHYHEEVDAEYLKLNLLPKDALYILQFFADNRFIDKGDGKKKLS